MATQTGLDRIAHGDSEALNLLRGRRVGLLAHAASVDSNYRHALDVLRGAGVEVAALFGPEHGIAGSVQDMVGVDGDEFEGVPCYSLYGDDEAALSPKREWLEGLDAVVIDLQDVGARYYTYIWTAALMLKAAAAESLETVVLDRPNPLGGAVIEGALQRPGYLSFVGLYPLPVRHGLTIAEVLRYVQQSENIDAEALRVVTMQGWSRELLFQDTGLPWVQPSPNMPSVDTVLVYPGACLIEGTRLSEGRGTTRPFEIWGHPGLDLRAIVDQVRVSGATLRALNFEPTFQKHAGNRCLGLQVHVTNMQEFRSFSTYLSLLNVALRQLPTKERWRSEAYEFVSDRPAIDLLTGGPEFREMVDVGEAPDETIKALCVVDPTHHAARSAWLLY